MFRIKLFSKYFGVVLLVLSSVIFAAAQAENQQLVNLRHQLAFNYMKPTPHLALARYYWDKGDRLQAFYISEYARRARFPEPIFNRAFQTAFYKTTAASKDNQGETLFNKAAALQKAGKLKEAEELFVKAAELAPDSVEIQSWVSRFFTKAKPDSQKALQYYLNAYFLDPHAYETEYVESRIRSINWETAQARYLKLTKSGTQPSVILNDLNPTVIVIALEQMTARWKPAYLKLFLEKMSHDDETVRWNATEGIMKNVNRSFDSTLQELLIDTDLRKRGLAAYIAVRLWKQSSFDHLRLLLREEAQLLRFDAISALIEGGGEAGMQIIIEHRQRETDPTIREMIDKSLSKS